MGYEVLVAGALTLATLAWAAGVAQAQPVPVLENGKTKAVYDYTQRGPRAGVHPAAAGTDTDSDGVDRPDRDRHRPAERESGPTDKMPAIIDPSPYYTTVCRGTEGQCMRSRTANGDGVNDRWPLFYDNYFVPRGYAYIARADATARATRPAACMHGGPSDIAGYKSVVDWLNGRVKGYSAASRRHREGRRLAQRLESR